MGFKSALKKVPVLGKLLVSVNRKLKQKKFKSTEDYWKNRYGSGGNSGQGSYNEFAEYKGEVINAFVSEKNIQTLIEFGCGDGNQLSYFKVPAFIGYEVSMDAVEMCKAKFKNDSTKSFFLVSDNTPRTADLVLSLDVVYCLVEEASYNNYLKRLFDSSAKYVIIYSSNHNENQISVPHIRHRRFTDWVEANRPDFKLIKKEPNKFEAEVSNSSNSEWYYFEKVVEV